MKRRRELLTFVLAGALFAPGGAAAGPQLRLLPTKAGYVDSSGKMALKAQSGWEDWTEFTDGLAGVKLKGHWGFMNKHGRLVIPAAFQPPITYTLAGGCFHGQEVHDALVFSEKVSAVSVGGKAGFIDWTGAFAIEPRFDAALPFTDGLARVRMNGKWGFIDHTGKTVIVPQFELTGPFADERAAVMKKDRWGYIDKNGSIVIPLQYQGAREFQAGLAAVQLSPKKWTYIDKSGKKIKDAPDQN